MGKLTEFNPFTLNETTSNFYLFTLQSGLLYKQNLLNYRLTVSHCFHHIDRNNEVQTDNQPQHLLGQLTFHPKIWRQNENEKLKISEKNNKTYIYYNKKWSYFPCHGLESQNAVVLMEHDCDESTTKFSVSKQMRTNWGQFCHVFGHVWGRPLQYWVTSTFIITSIGFTLCFVLTTRE